METASTTTLSARIIRIQESEDRAERRWRADDWLEQCARMMSSPEIRQQVGPVPRTHKDPRRFARSVILSEFDGAERMNAHGTRCNNRILKAGNCCSGGCAVSGRRAAGQLQTSASLQRRGERLSDQGEACRRPPSSAYVRFFQSIPEICAKASSRACVPSRPYPCACTAR